MPTTSVAPGLTLLGGAPDAVALIAEGSTLDYAELAERVERRRFLLGTTRRLVMLQARNDVDSIVTYLAALEGGHPLLLVAAGDDAASVRNRARLVERFAPDVIASGGAGGHVIDEVRSGSAHEFAEELALLVSTSGSTGSPKLVRLSRENVDANARAIAEYLQLAPADRAATTLPMHYCYGLSVINSHLRAGASLLLTDRSVTDDAFWDAAHAHRITSFAGVPYTYELLEAGGLTERMPRSIRTLTQAGGRLAPDAVRRFARLGERRGFGFVVMYGQTEATARMAYVPPHLAEQAAGAIGRAIPGGRLRIDAEAGADVGELVYEGPNVMLGYAESPRDFRLGRTVHELRTGDLARRRPDGLFEVVGRRNRFVKVFGLRLDLDAVQRLLAEEGIDARTASAGERLLVFVRSEREAAAAAARTAALLGMPERVVRAYAVDEFPRTATGKPDVAALVRFAELLDAVPPDLAPDAGSPATPADVGTGGAPVASRVRDLFAVLLARPDATVDDSFASLDGDSLSYVEVSVRLEEMLGGLPRNWPSMTVRELALAGEPEAPRHAELEAARPTDVPDDAARRPRRLARVETPAVLRAVAIVLIVATHADLISLQGGAHLLLAVAGYNLARFQLADVPGRTRVRRLLGGVGQVIVPAVLWIAVVALVSGKYAWTTALLVNHAVPGDGRWNEQWQFWFLEALVWSTLGIAALLALRPIDRAERRHPWAFAVGVLALALAVRGAATGIHAEGVDRYAIAGVFWCIALGWAIARADGVGRRVAVSVVAIAATVGFFGQPEREAVVVAGVLLLVWVPRLRLPRVLVPAVRLLAAASLFIYLTHWVVYPAWEQTAPAVGTLLSLVVGIGAWTAYRGARALVRRRPAAQDADVPVGARSSSG